MHRVIVNIAKAMAVAELIYIGLGLIFLNSGMLTRLINGSSPVPDVQIKYDFAYSLIPGFAKANHLTVRVNDDDVQLYFHLHSVAVHVNLDQLFHRVFFADSVGVEGLDFRMRLRRAANSLKSKDVEYLPPIPGLVPVRQPPEPPPPPGHQPWKVRLTGITIHGLEEAWVESYRFEGKASVSGNFFLSPGHNVQVDHAHLETVAGTVRVGETEVASQIEARIATTLGPFEKTQFKDPNDILDYLSTTIEGRAKITGISFLNHYFRNLKHVQLDGGTGPLAMHVVLQNGRLVAPSQLTIQAEALQAKLWEQRAQGNAEVDWHVTAENKEQRGRLTIVFPRFEIKRLGGSAVIKGRDLSLVAKTTDLELKNPFDRLKVEIRTPEARITDLSYFQAYLPKESRLSVHGGEGRLDAAVFASSEPKHKDTGYLHLDTRHAALDLPHAKLQGDLTIDGVLHEGDLRKGRLDISGTQIYLRKVQATSGNRQFRDWWGEIDIHKGILLLAKNKEFQADIRMKGRDARPILAVVTQNAIPGVLGGVLAFENLRARLKLLVTDDLLKVSQAHAEGGSTAVTGWIRSDEKEKQGRLLVEWGPAAAGLSIQDDKIEIKLDDAYHWFREPVPGE